MQNITGKGNNNMIGKTITYINPRYHKTDTEIMSENDWVEASKKDTKHFEYLYNMHYEAVFRFIYQRTGNEDLAHETTSNVFFKALKNIQKYQFRGLPFVSWLLRIAQNETYNIFRNEKADRVVKLESDHLNNIAQEIEEEAYEDLKPLLKEALSNLKEEEIQMIEMRFFEGRPFKEMAEILDKNESAIKMKVYRILEKIKMTLTANNKSL